VGRGFFSVSLDLVPRPTPITRAGGHFVKAPTGRDLPKTGVSNALLLDGETQVKRCPSCRHFSACQKLCRRAEKYVSQDSVIQKELLVGVVAHVNQEWPVGESEYQRPIFTRQEWKFVIGFLGRRDLNSWKPLQEIPWLKKKWESLPAISS
jgi:hypothetical protein